MSESFSAEAEAVVASLRDQVGQRDAVIAQLLERIDALEARLSKNSKNSSKPPSTDNPFTKPTPRSLRKPSGRRPGKQGGDPGARLEPHPDPDQVRIHAPGACAGCGSGLDDAVVLDEQVRQVLDLPAIQVEVTEHRAQTRRCRCGHLTTGSFPDAATAPTCYGPGVAAVATYLLARQHVPVARAAEMLSDCFGVRVSTGWLAGLLPEGVSDGLCKRSCG